MAKSCQSANGTLTTTHDTTTCPKCSFIHLTPLGSSREGTPYARDIHLQRMQWPVFPGLRVHGDDYQL